MPTQLEILLDKIKALENELIEELQTQEEEFSYEIHKRRVDFEKNVIIRHRKYAKRILNYLTDAHIKHILSAPFIWICIIPILLVDVTVSLYQWVCFPIYGIPKVNRQDYIVFDRRYLQYLNIIEKINCAYCSYFNGLIGYLQEIGAHRTILVPNKTCQTHQNLTQPLPEIHQLRRRRKIPSSNRND